MKKLLLAPFLVLAVAGFAQTWQDTVHKIDALFATYAGAPGAQLAISRNGQPLFSRAWGLADLEHDVPLTTTSLIEAGSISKHFTAACILLLEQQGKLSLSDDVRKFLPEMPDYGTPILLRHMIQHTSGLRDWGSVAAVSGWPRSTKTYDNNDALLIVARQKSLNNVPGAEYIYSNSNYNLLAIVIERVSGLSLADFSKKYLFTPAGMSLSQWRDDHRRVVKNRAIAYSPAGAGYQTDMPNEFVYGNGGLLTTAEELLRWNDFIFGGKLGSPSLLPKQLYSYPFLNGAENNYGAGLVIQTTKGWRDITHNGATAGYRADLHYFPELGLSIAWISNNSRSMAVSGEVINLFLPKKSGPASRTPAAYAVTPAVLNTYTGWYRNERSGDGLQVTFRDTALVLLNQQLRPTGAAQFALGQNRVEFRKGGFSLITATRDTIAYTAMPMKATRPLAEYAGTFYSTETESSVAIGLVNGALVVRVKPTDKDALTPTYPDGFSFDGGNLFFTRDGKGAITGLKISVSRARKITFSKVN
jgi:CubicO group peptidase (beta-lactamase class C family)